MNVFGCESFGRKPESGRAYLLRVLKVENPTVFVRASEDSDAGSEESSSGSDGSDDSSSSSSESEEVESGSGSEDDD
jgi:hypothetical protein